MTKPNDGLEELRQQAKEFAADYDITYKSIKIAKKGGFVTFKQEADYDFDGVSGNAAVSIPRSIVMAHSDMKAKAVLDARIDELEIIPDLSVTAQYYQHRLTQLKAQRKGME